MVYRDCQVCSSTEFEMEQHLQENTVKALLELYLTKHGSPRLNNQSLAAATDFLSIFLEAAIERSLKEGRLQLDENLSSEHLAAVLPQLLLDC